jgi:hypothetical protein
VLTKKDVFFCDVPASMLTRLMGQETNNQIPTTEESWRVCKYNLNTEQDPCGIDSG